MRNLELLKLINKPISVSINEDEKFDHTPDCTYFTANSSLYKHTFNTNTLIELCPLFCEDVVFIKALTIENKICVVSRTNIQFLDLNGDGELKTIPFSDICAASWNPTEELVVIVSESGCVATYTVDYENAEARLQGESSVLAKVPDTVYVGWGSKETQFRGSEGKLTHCKPIEAEPVEDKVPRISWRGNSEMFAINFCSDGKRMFTVFEAPCKPLYRSEECVGLQPLIAWRPSGNMIACVKEIQNQKDVIVFEKNGYKRFNFNLDICNVNILKICWSPCATILTILTEDQKDKFKSIHLFTASNYKWYEKQRLTFSNENPFLHFDWVETNQFLFTLRVLTQKELANYVFVNKVHDFNGVCAVIDGRNLNLTDFSDSIMPPILNLVTITAASSINLFSISGDLVEMIDSDNCLNVIECGKIQNLVKLRPKLPLCFDFPIKDSLLFAQDENSTNPIFNSWPDNTVQQTCFKFDNESWTCRLTSDCHLYINDEEVSKCANSFKVFGEYLLFTTKLNVMHCLKLTNRGKNSYTRSVEQGATIVTAIPHSSKIVLQLPRGNLETISCRLISIDILDNLLKTGKWEDAIRFLRLEKLNANLLFDLNPQRFLSQIESFVQGVNSLNELKNLCLDFEEINVLNTIYKNCRNCEVFSNKIQIIFEAIFSYFERVDYADYITTIVAVKYSFFTLREALIYLQDLLRRSTENSEMKTKLIEAVNVLKVYGCDQDKLYAEALLLYDIELARFVAGCCQLDPRIYEQHLNNLKNLEEVEMRYEINVFGKNPKLAIQYLLRCPNKDSHEIVEFIKNNNVSREAYQSCKRNNKHFVIVAESFARDLSRSGHHKEAGIVFKKCGMFRDAVEEFVLGLDWKLAVDALNELQMANAEKRKILNDLARRLIQNKFIREAAILYEFYIEDYEMALKVFMENFMFEDALHLAKKHKRSDVVVSEVVPFLNKHKTLLKEQLDELNALFTKYSNRLSTVRDNKFEKLSNPIYDDFEHDDLFSDVGSTITKSSRSSRSRSSTASSRNRRKEEKKKQDLREGGLYEDIALIRALHGTIAEIYKKGEEVTTACLLLLQETDIPYEEVQKIHDAYWDLHDTVKNATSEIWPSHFYQVVDQSHELRILADKENFEHLDVEYRTPPSTVKNVTRLRIFC